MNWNWMEDVRWYPDALHFLGGYGITLTGAYLGHRFWVAIAVILLSLLKEIGDVYWEKNPPQSVADSVRDWIGYCSGVAVAALVTLPG